MRPENCQARVLLSCPAATPKLLLPTVWPMDAAPVRRAAAELHMIGVEAVSFKELPVFAEQRERAAKAAIEVDAGRSQVIGRS
jgi:hypothetical protein